MSRKRSTPQYAAPLYVPQPGELVMDTAHHDVRGVYMATEGSTVFLRPEGGGIEWTTRSADIKPVDCQAGSARKAEQRVSRVGAERLSERLAPEVARLNAWSRGAGR
ncbi:hypothetical protein ACIQGZ_10695 [Streptomyces sp. NPDC092296]|uniref:hypothetical protein n=1 Tax=Streptomyces sp. NPDC092296 TaxID=3366012 RepID=UPI0037FEFD3F